MNNWIYGLKREYWEYKRLLVLMPLLVSGMFILIAIVATWTHGDSSIETVLKDTGLQLDVANSVNKQDADVELRQADSVTKQDDEQDSFWFSGVYLVVAWIAAMFYALTCLYNDRRNQSILYWKTMPVSELHSVLVKLVFAVLAFSIVAILMSWLSAAVLMSYSWLVFPPEMLADDAGGMSLRKLVLWPIITSLIAVLWCSPFFTLLLYVSAKAKKMPFLLLTISVVLVSVVERVVLRSDHVFGFLFSHSPLGLVSTVAQMNSAGEILNRYLIDLFPSLLLGLIISVVFVWRATWLRNHDFEI